mgnify:CR=1 FL=1
MIKYLVTLCSVLFANSFLSLSQLDFVDQNLVLMGFVNNIRMGSHSEFLFIAKSPWLLSNIIT